MRHYRILSIIGLLGMALLARAYPNLNATTGILAVPTADVVNTHQLQLGADVLFFNDTTVNGRLIYGLADRLELGVGVAAGNDTFIGANLKYVLPMCTGNFRWAAGVSVLSGSDTGGGFQVYGVGSVPIPIKGVTGAQIVGSFGANFTDVDEASAFRPFAGAQLCLGPYTELAGEFILESGDFNESVFSAVIRQKLTNQWRIQAGFTNATGFTGNEDYAFIAGISYDFNKGTQVICPSLTCP